MLLDAHLHLHRYTGDVAPVLAEIRRRRVFSIAVADDPESHARTLELGGDEVLVLPAFGVHPARATEWAGRLDELLGPLDSVAMVGDIGLDRHAATNADSHPAQDAVCEFLLVEAKRRDLVVNLHTKAAEERIVSALRRHDVRRVIVHRYAGPVRAFRDLVDLGAYFSVGVGVLHDDTACAIAAEVPTERLLTATDNPGVRTLPPGTLPPGGEEGRPSLLIDVQRALARVRGVPVRDLQDQVRANFERLIVDDERLETPYRRARDSFVS